MSPNTCHTFDIFDTLLVRRVTRPHHVFRLVGRRLRSAGILDLEPELFAAARLAAEAAARENSEREDITLAAILAELTDRLGLSSDQQAAVEAVELAVEAELLAPVPGAAERLAAARHTGRVVFLTEMYLPAAFLAAQLERHGLRRGDEPLLVSGEVGLSKHTGALYRHALLQLGLAPGQVRHTGDHPHADQAAPRRLGLAVTPAPEAVPNRYERLLEEFAAATGGLASVVAGAGRLARLTIPAADEGEAALRDLAAGAAAPAVVGFVLWLLRQAPRDGVRRLYFLARDGWVLHRVAHLLAPRLGVDLELRYLAASRQSWLLPALRRVDAAALRWLVRPADGLTCRQVLARVNQSPEAVAGELTAAGWPAARWDKPLTTADRERLGEALARPLAEWLLALAAAERATVVGYLIQEGLTDGGPCAIVDAGWNGTLQDALAELLGDSAPPVAGYYFGLNRCAGQGPGPRRAWFYDHRLGRGIYHLVPGIDQFLELLLPADHGLVTGFSEREGRFEPVCAEVPDDTVATRRRVIRETILETARQLLLDDTLVATGADLLEAAAATLAELKQRPTRAEAAALGGLPVADDQTGRRSFPLAQPFRWRDLPGVLRTGRMPEPTLNNWYHGSLTLTPGPLVFSLKVAARLGRWRRR